MVYKEKSSGTAVLVAALGVLGVGVVLYLVFLSANDGQRDAASSQVSSEPQSVTVAATKPAPVEGISTEAEVRLARMEAAYVRINQRLDGMESRLDQLVAAAGAPGEGAVAGDVAASVRVLAGDLAALRGQVERMKKTGLGLESEGGRAVLEETVRRVQKELQAQRGQRSRHLNQAALEEWLADLAEAASMSDQQLGEVSGLLQEQRAGLEKLKDQMTEEDIDFAQMREKARSIRHDTNRQVRELLSESQYEIYKKRSRRFMQRRERPEL
jgi:hypothetical protein